MPISRVPGVGLDSGSSGVGLTNLSATGTPSSTTFLRGDNSWADPGAVGVNQTWQNLTGSRALGTTYTNSTGRPIAVAVQQNSTPAGASGYGGAFIINGATVPSNYAYSANAGYSTASFYIIPAGATYSCPSSNSSLTSWFELR